MRKRYVAVWRLIAAEFAHVDKRENILKASHRREDSMAPRRSQGDV